MSHYETLGVQNTATPDEIKSAYRKLAMKWHPDRNKDNLSESEAKIKIINEAYSILSDQDKRREYDVSLQPRNNFFHGETRFNTNFNDFDDLFNSWDHVRPARNHTMYANISIEEAYCGVQIKGTVVPAGIQNYTVANTKDGPVIIHVNNDSKYHLEGKNITTDVQINSIEAMLGVTVKFSYFKNTELEFNIPPGTSNGQKLRIAGKGLPGNIPGDLYIVIKIKTNSLTSAEKEQLRSTLGHLVRTPLKF